MNSSKYWIALSEARGIGPANLKEIYSALSSMKLSIADLFGLNHQEIEDEFNFPERVIEAIISAKDNLSKIEEDYFTLLDHGVNTITFYSDLYPAKLHRLLENNIPPMLYTYGNIDILSKKTIALLGDKNISEKGELIAYVGSKELASHSIPVLSGFAKGAGMISHRSALENGGETIAVVPYGMKFLKIPDMLADVIDLERMLIISPFYPTVEADKYNAFSRNRLICALSYAVYIIEAPADGGIFEAAKSAKNLGVPLFTTEYSEYPESASGNKKILEEMEGHPVRGRIVNDMLTPNMDKIIGYAKFA